MIPRFVYDLPQPSGKSSRLIRTIRQITRYVVPAASDDRAIAVLDLFLKNQELLCIPVLRKGKLCGLINRHRFMENHMVGRYGFGHSLNYYKSVEPLLEDDYLQVDDCTTIEGVAQLVQKRPREKMYDDICVISGNRYIGVVSVAEVLNAIMENNLILAIGANPLSGLPGNDFIQREISRLLDERQSFDIAYIDIDNFKPYNDKHGFAKGDEVIKTLAQILMAVLQQTGRGGIGFAGHIGGDDFILISTPHHSTLLCEKVIAEFAEYLPEFHDPDEIELGYYQSCDRSGAVRKFNLLSLSIAIVSTELRSYPTYAEIASLATGLKKKAKSIEGSAVVRDRRFRTIAQARN